MPRLLFVDDQPNNLVALEAILGPFGYQTYTASSGRGALEMLDATKPDLVLLDLVLQDIDGLEVLTSMRAHPGFEEVPIILLTAHSDREHRVRGLQAGADDFLEKPLDAEVLVARVRALLRLKQSRDELRRSRDENKRARLTLRERNVQLENLQRDQRELMDFIVHDLKNPLTVISANLEFVLHAMTANTLTAATASKRAGLIESLEDATEATARLRGMVQDLLAVSRLEHSQFPLHPESLEVEELLRIVTASYARKAEERHVSLSVSSPPGMRVRADMPLLRRVLENLVDNSLRFTPSAGRIVVSAECDQEVCISISNTGPSIPPRDRARVFEKFARLADGPSGCGNVGLGLYFCKRAVEANAGRIDVTETPEWPTSFVIRLPRA